MGDTAGKVAGWNGSAPISKADGLAKLGDLANDCSPQQRTARRSACQKLHAWMKRLPDTGYSIAGSKTFKGKEAKSRGNAIRIDLEIHAGSAFTGIMPAQAIAC